MSCSQPLQLREIDELKLWMRNEARFEPNGDDDAPTLLDMGGGKYYVSASKYPSFLQMYSGLIARQMQNSALGLVDKAISLTECRGHIFRYFIDFDIVSPHAFEDTDYEMLAQVVMGTVRRFLDPERADTFMRMVLCTCPPVPKGDQIKVGVHIHFPDLLVDKHMALQIREMLIVDFHRDIGPTIGTPSAERVRDIIDASVYRQPSNGLRMLGSAKVTSCVHCGGNAELRNTCNVCIRSKAGAGVEYMRKNYHRDRAYFVRSVYVSGLIDRDQTQSCKQRMLSAVTLSSIRCPRRDADGPVVVCPAWKPSTACPPVIPAEQRNGGRTHADMAEMKADKEGTTKLFRDRQEIPHCDERVVCMRDAVRSLDANWAEVECRQAFYLPGSGNYVFKSHGIGSFWCKNKMDHHSSSSVYWCFEPRSGGKVYQRCFSQKEQCPRPHAPCKCSLFTSKMERLSKMQSSVLWPSRELVTPVSISARKRLKLPGMHRVAGLP